MEIHNVVCNHMHVHDGMEGVTIRGQLVWSGSKTTHKLLQHASVGKLQYG